jgi:hypothetical protein
MPGENSGNMNVVKVSAETARENARAAAASNSSNKKATVTTSAGNTLYANSANVREDRVSYTSNYVPPEPPKPIPNPQTKTNDWTNYRSGEREDAVISNPVNEEIVISPSQNAFITALPQNPIPIPVVPEQPKIKTATPEIILFNEDILPIEVMTDLIFEDIGGQELIDMSRHDTITGQYVSNQLIKNLTLLNQHFTPKNILSIQNTSDKIFSNYGIKLETKLPTSVNNVYLDNETGDIVINLINLESDEQVEVEISIGGTIYEVVL